MELIQNAMQGFQNYNRDGKFLVLFLGSLLFLWVRGSRRQEIPEHRQCAEAEKGIVFGYYGLIAGILTICPVTAALLMKYQTGFYEYAWIFAMVPVTATCACALALLVKGPAPGQSSRPVEWRCFGLLAVFGCVAFLCSNPAQWSAQRQEKAAEMAGAEETVALLQELREERGLERLHLWAPEEVLAYVRLYDAEITCLYGRNMWEKSLDGYSYDVYDEVQTALYEWMEAQPGATETSAAECVEAALEREVNCIILPRESGALLSEGIEKTARKMGFTVAREETGGYSVFVFDRV